jgi:hypothetical protein
MLLKKEYMNIYFVTAVLAAAFIFMAVSTWNVVGHVNGQTSVDLAIDHQVDQCWAKHKLDQKFGR